jgi:hypothetical protein
MGVWIAVVLIKILGVGWASATIYSFLIIAWEIFEFVYRHFFIAGYRDTLLDLIVGLVTWSIVAALHPRS